MFCLFWFEHSDFEMAMGNVIQLGAITAKRNINYSYSWRNKNAGFFSLYA